MNRGPREVSAVAEDILELACFLQERNYAAEGAAGRKTGTPVTRSEPQGQATD